MEIDRIVREAHETATEKGWCDGPPNFLEMIALIHSELSEALEDYRHHREPHVIHYETGPQSNKRKPCGIPIELADVVIRVAHLCGRYDINLTEAIELKLAYNKERPYRHGNLRT